MESQGRGAGASHTSLLTQIKTMLTGFANSQSPPMKIKSLLENCPQLSTNYVPSICFPSNKLEQGYAKMNHGM